MNNKIQKIFKIVTLFIVIFYMNNIFAEPIKLTLIEPTSRTNVLIDQEFQLKNPEDCDLVLGKLGLESYYVGLYDVSSSKFVAVDFEPSDQYLYIKPKDKLLTKNTSYIIYIQGFTDTCNNKFVSPQIISFTTVK